MRGIRRPHSIRYLGLISPHQLALLHEAKKVLLVKVPFKFPVVLEELVVLPLLFAYVALVVDLVEVHVESGEVVEPSVAELAPAVPAEAGTFAIAHLHVNLEGGRRHPRK